MGEMPFPSMQALFDPFFPEGLQWYWKGDFVKSLPDDAIETHIAHAVNAPTELSLMHLYPIDGAVQRVSKDDRVEHSRREVVHGDRRNQRRPETGRRIEDVGPRVLEGDSPVQPRGWVRELLDGR